MNTENNDPSETQETADEYVAELIDDSGTSAGESAEVEAEEPVADADVHELPVDAARVEKPSVIYDPSVLVPTKPPTETQPPSPFEDLAAKGGAIGAVVLGAFAFAGSFITSYAIINSFLGVLLGLWGLRSSHRKMALAGMLLCLISAFFCVVEISQWIQSFWPQEEF